MRIDHVINHREHCFKKLKYFYLIEQVIVSLVLLYWVYYDKLLKGKIGSSHLIPPQGNTHCTTPSQPHNLTTSYLYKSSQPPQRSLQINFISSQSPFVTFYFLPFDVIIKTFTISPSRRHFSEFLNPAQNYLDVKHFLPSISHEY